MDRKVTEGGKKIKKERGKKGKIIQSDICPYKFPTDFIQSIRWITKGMKRRSGRNPINFVHAIHICNFVFAIQSRRHATRNRFPLDSSNGYVYFSLLSPAPASSTVSSSSPPRRSPTLRFTSDDSQFLFQWLHLQFPWERERERKRPPFLLSRHLLTRFSRIPFHPFERGIPFNTSMYPAAVLLSVFFFF